MTVILYMLISRFGSNLGECLFRGVHTKVSIVNGHQDYNVLKWLRGNNSRERERENERSNVKC